MPGEVLVVDDSSPDGTGQLADQLAGRHDWLHVLHRPAKQGLGRAYLAGFEWALAAAVQPRHRDGLRPVPPGGGPAGDAGRRPTDADLVLGSRYAAGGGVDGWPLLRRLISRGGCAVRAAGAGRADPRSHRRLQVLPPLGARVARPVARAGRRLRLPDRAHLPHAAAWAGGVVELPITFTDRALRRVEDEPLRSCWRRCGRCRRCGCGPLRGALLERPDGEPRVSLIP